MSNLRKKDAKNDLDYPVDRDAFTSEPAACDRKDWFHIPLGGDVPKDVVQQQIGALWSDLESVRKLQERNREIVLKALFWSRVVVFFCVFQIVLKIIDQFNP